eukprot:scaffold104676_cov57-Phaeocystis_antarctica.AAC.2
MSTPKFVPGEDFRVGSRLAARLQRRGPLAGGIGDHNVERGVACHRRGRARDPLEAEGARATVRAEQDRLGRVARVQCLEHSREPRRQRLLGLEGTPVAVELRHRPHRRVRRVEALPEVGRAVEQQAARGPHRLVVTLGARRAGGWAVGLGRCPVG